MGNPSDTRAPHSWTNTLHSAARLIVPKSMLTMLTHTQVAPSNL